jgi:hypothetical protein
MPVRISGIRTQAFSSTNLYTNYDVPWFVEQIGPITVTLKTVYFPPYRAVRSLQQNTILQVLKLIIIHFNSLLIVESTATRPVTETAQCR